MIYALEIKNEEAALRHCYGYGAQLEIPEILAGYPVTELSAYALSDQRDRRKSSREAMPGTCILWDDESGCVLPQQAPPEDIPPVDGKSISSVRLPSSLKKIGAYAFYNCTGLCRLSFHGTLADLGAGLFSCCHSLGELDVQLGPSQSSCLKEMLQELHQKLTVYMNGSIKARLVFPAYYEEVVENTPARVFSTQMHGSGRNYRNSFNAGKFDFRSYDACFRAAREAEDFGTLLEMTLGRLLYPADLLPQRRTCYEDWLYDNFEAAVKKLSAGRDIEALYFIARNERTTIEQLGYAARVTADEGYAEASGLIMDALGRKKPAGRARTTASGRFRL